MKKLLRLTQDVKNPKPDRRSKDIFDNPIMPAGTMFVLNDRDHDGITELSLFNRAKGDQRSSWHDRYASIYEQHHFFKILIEFCERVDPDHGEWLAMHDFPVNDFLERLLQNGKTTREELTIFYSEWLKEVNK